MNPWLPPLLILLATGTAVADLFVGSFNQNCYYRYDENTGAFLGIFTSASTLLREPQRGIFGPDGNFYVASGANDRILRYDGHSGALLDIFIQNGAKGLPSGTLDYPVDLALGLDGALYVSSEYTDSILRFDASSGAYLGKFVPGGSSSLDGPCGIAFHGGDLFIAGHLSGQAYRYDGTTGAFELAFGKNVLTTPNGVAFGSDGNLYVVSGDTFAIEKFDPLTGAYLGQFVAAGAGGLSRPTGIEFGPDQNLYVASLTTDSIKRFDGVTGAYLGDFIAPGSGGLTQPNFITFAVPEPSLLGLAGPALLLLRLRRRRT